ncbi:MAG: type IV secretion system DNA-binding domain-containing protein [Clostridia bacterium]|nr:type IV secretion system DNA-binding domain-containing protein [Clostridia bacterium]
MAMNIRVQYGSDASKNPVPVSGGQAFLTLPGSCLGRPANLTVDTDTVSRHMLLVGGTGVGKTNLMFRMVDQTIRRMGPDDVMLIFDSKGDYYEKFRSRTSNVVVGNSAEYDAVSQKWNIFQEILADGPDRKNCRLNAMEIARSLFAERMRSTTNAFFPGAAQDVFASLLVSITRDAETDPAARAALNNQDFMDYLQSSSGADLCAQLAAYPDLTATTSYIEGENEQSQGVIAEMHSVIRDLFVGKFAEKGTFSLRNFIRARGKKVLFLEYDISIGSILTPVYRLLVDLALKEALSQHNRKGNIFLFLDEFKLLPHLQHIDDAVNFGRSKGVKVAAGLQSIEQLYDLYGQSRGRSIAAGFSTVIAFRANDEATMKYIRGLYGKNLYTVEVIDARNNASTTVHEGDVVPDWTMCSLGRGTAVVCMPQQQPFVMYFDPFS